MRIKSFIVSGIITLFLLGCTLKTISCEEQGYVHKKDVNVIINLTNELISVTNVCLDSNLLNLSYYEVK